MNFKLNSIYFAYCLQSNFIDFKFIKKFWKNCSALPYKCCQCLGSGNLICQINCNLSLSLAKPELRVFHYCNLFASENAKYLFNFEHSSIYLFAQSNSNKKAPSASSQLPARSSLLSDIWQGISIAISKKIENFLAKHSKAKQNENHSQTKCCSALGGSGRQPLALLTPKRQPRFPWTQPPSRLPLSPCLCRWACRLSV